jgi:hypothetical protein
MKQSAKVPYGMIKTPSALRNRIVGLGIVAVEGNRYMYSMLREYP